MGVVNRNSIDTKEYDPFFNFATVRVENGGLYGGFFELGNDLDPQPAAAVASPAAAPQATEQEPIQVPPPTHDQLVAMYTNGANQLHQLVNREVTSTTDFGQWMAKVDELYQEFRS